MKEAVKCEFPMIIRSDQNFVCPSCGNTRSINSEELRNVFMGMLSPVICGRVLKSNYVMNEDDVNMLDHFWNTKGDLERWSEWESRKDKIDVRIVDAWKEYKRASSRLSGLIGEAAEK